jgi:hypothetical protein
MARSIVGRCEYSKDFSRFINIMTRRLQTWENRRLRFAVLRKAGVISARKKSPGAEK